MAWVYGALVGPCSIVTSRVDGSYGSVFMWLEKQPHDVEIAMLLSGPYAEWRRNKGEGQLPSSETMLTDIFWEFKQASEVLREAPDLEQIYLRGVEIIQEVLEDPDYWAAVEALALELLRQGRVGPTRAKRIIEEAVNASYSNTSKVSAKL